MNQKRHLFLARATMTLLLAVLTSTWVWADELSGSGTPEDPYIINSTDDWNLYVANLAANGNHYGGKSISLTNDIKISAMAGKKESYLGTCSFYGNNHTLTVNLENTDPEVEGVAPFRYFNGRIFDLYVKGTVTSAGNYAGGMVGFTYNGSQFKNCVVTTAITTSAKVAGGLIGNIAGDSYPNVTFNECVFAGSITNTGNVSYRSAGGFFGEGSGWSCFINCLENGTYTNFGLMNPRGAHNSFSNNDTDYVNLYYVNKIGEVQYVTDINGCHQVLNSVPTSEIYQTHTLHGYTFYQPAIVNNLHDTYVYNGETINLGYTLTMGTTPMTDGTDYEVTIRDNNSKIVAPADLKAVGTYTISFTAKTGNEAGYLGQTASYTFSIIAEGENLDGYVFTTEGEGDQKVYLISNEADLKRLSDYVNSGHRATGMTFKQKADIKMTGEFSPIGISNNRFYGNFDGGNFTITNLIINNPERKNQGLFGIADGCTIKNVTLKDCDITGKENVGGIVGYFSGGSITNCHVNGAIKATVSGASYHGGIVGYTTNNSNITDCTVTGTISTQYNNDNFGGIVGYLNGHISGCENAANISGPGDYHGGLIGRFYNRSYDEHANNCLNRGTVEGTENVGVISGIYSNKNNFKNCYYVSPCVTKLFGNNDSEIAGCAERAYFLNIGEYVSDVTITEAASFTSAIDGKKFYRKGNWTATLTPSAPDGNSAISYTCEGGTLSNPTDIDGTHTLTITGEKEVIINALISSNAGVDIAEATIADIPEQRWFGNVAITPALTVTYNDTPLTLGTDYVVECTDNIDQGTATATVKGINGYKGTNTQTFEIKDLHLQDPKNGNNISNPYLIETADDLEALANLVNSGIRRRGYYLQTKNISLNNKEHTAIGNSQNSFYGCYNGGNNTISDWTINKPNDEYQGLFGYTYYSNIDNVIVDNCSITANSNAGGIIGRAYCTNVSNCFSNANVQGSSYIGSIIGCNSSSTLVSNYHSATSTGGIGSNKATTGTDEKNACVVVKIAASDGVTLSLPEKADYEWNNEKLYKSGAVVTLNYDVPENMFFDRYTVNSGSISNAGQISGEHTLTGFTTDVVITGNYVSERTDLGNAGATIAEINSQTYNLNAYHPVPVVTMGNETLVEGIDYTVGYNDECINAGEHSVIVTGLGRYNGTISQTFIINPYDISKCYFHDVEDISYTGNEITVTPKVTHNSNSNVLNAGEDKDYTYVISPATVQALGKYTLTITGNGNYTGTKETSFNVIYGVPTDFACTKVTNYSANFKWYETGVATKWTIQYSTDNTFATSETITVDATNVTLKRLTPQTVYYARVKADYGVGEESDWSSVVSFQPTSDIAYGSDNWNSSYLPTYSYNRFSLSQQIYTASEMGGKSGIITSISFYCKSNAMKRDITLYLVNTEKNSFSNGTDWIKVKSDDEVFNGTVNFVNNDWTTITLTKPFAYDGTKNLAIITDDNTNSYGNYAMDFAASSTGSSTYQAMYVYSFNTNYDPTNPNYQCQKRENKKCNVRIGFEITELEIAEKDSEAEAQNSIIIADNDGKTRTVKLAGRTLYKDGDWNTICLPFSLDADQIADSPLAGATLMELDGDKSNLNDGTLTLNFTDATSIQAGKPYLVKWVDDADFVIKSSDDWNTFADNVTKGTESYSGKKVRLDADIEIKTMAGNYENPFKGTFDGNSHKLTVSLNNDGETGDGDEHLGVAPFRFTDGATINNLTVEGTITTAKRKYAAGIIGMTKAGTNVIQNCISSVEIYSTVTNKEGNDGTHGGFVGKASGTVNITNCLFNGALTTSSNNSTTKCGGFVGWNDGTLNISYSFYAPVLPDGKYQVSASGSSTFARNGGIFIRCYFTRDLGTLQGVNASGFSNSKLLGNEYLGSGWQEKDGKVVPVMELKNNITNPVFVNVTIDKRTNNVESTDGTVTFTGNYDYRTFIEEDKSILFLGEKNTLYWPQPGLDDAKANVVYPSIGACRAYFKLNDVDAGDIQKTRMNFEEETTGIQTTNFKNLTNSDEWYTLNGVKLDKQPTKKGMYIHNGNKVVIK